MKPPQKVKSGDDFQTPPEALTPLCPYLHTFERDKWRIWEPAEGKGNLTAELKRQGFQVFGSDINQSPAMDFLTYEPRDYDCIITNPPYSLKQQFLERCYELSKPFALLMPLTTLETAKRQKLFREGGVEIVFMPKRVKFKFFNGDDLPTWFATAWFTHGLNIGQQLTFTL